MRYSLVSRERVLGWVQGWLCVIVSVSRSEGSRFPLPFTIAEPFGGKSEWREVSERRGGGYSRSV